jgi:membrane associated rhomboid family serine protease
VSTARRTSDLGRAFTFGGRVPGGLGLLLATILVATVGAWVLGLKGAAALDPVAILTSGQAWRLVTWAFVQGDPFTLLFGGLMLYWLVPQLSYTWGERRVLGLWLGITFGASVVTLALALVWPPARLPHLGLWPTANALLLMWAMLYPEQQVNIWGVLPVTGRTLALMVVFGTVLYGLAGAFTPHFAALGLGWFLGRGRLPTGRWKLQARDWWAEREFKRKSRHLKVVDKGGRDKDKDEPPRWMN